MLQSLEMAIKKQHSHIDDARYWDKVAQGWFLKSYADEILAEHKRKTHLNLVARWAEVTNNQRILKTDLFEEAFGPDQFLFDLAKANSTIVGIDSSNEIVKQAKRNAKHYGVGGEYICCDVRQLPLRSNSIDLIISDSTLDHFHDHGDIIASLQELRRILCAGGTLILTMDNKGKLGEPMDAQVRYWSFRLADRRCQLRLTPPWQARCHRPDT